MSNIPQLPYLAKIKPVYDVASYGEDLSIQFGIDNLTLQSITASTAAFFKSTDTVNIDGTATTVFPVEDMDIVLSDINTFGIAHEGDDTAFNRIYVLEPDMTAFIYKASIKMAFSLNVSAFTNGSRDLESVQFIIKQSLDDNTTELIDNFSIPATLTALTATGTQIFVIVADRHYTNFKARKGRPITVQIIVTTGGSGTNTFQVGMMPCFPFQAAAILKPITTSVMSFHVHPSLDHAFPVFRDQNSMQLLDYSGISNPQGSGVG